MARTALRCAIGEAVSSSPSLAELSWTEEGQPVSVRFGDIYYSRHDGLEQSRHVYLRHNQLEERWRTLPAGARFCIAETGFGTGLNFLAAWQLWDSTAPVDAHLHFVSAEKFPLAAADLRRVLELWPELAPWSEQLLQHYSSPVPGWQRLVFDGGRVSLTLLAGDALAMLGQLDARVDAWFLDGVTPQLDPDMWQPALYQQMARLSRPGTTLTTFTSAGEVRGGLIAAGFMAEPVQGHRSKREMLAARLPNQPAPGWTAPWFARPTGQPHAAREAMVIGAGLAGCCTAWALARRGWSVTLIERHPGEAREASGNAQGILYCKLSPHHPPLSRFIQSSYAYSLHLLRSVLPEDGIGWSACGVLQLSGNAKETARLRALAEQGYPAEFLHGVDAAEASAIAGVEVSEGGLHFPAGGWVNPPALCARLLQHPAIELKSCSEAMHLDYRADRWHAIDAQGLTLKSAPVAIVCSAGDSRRFLQTAHLPLKSIRGQVTRLPVTAGSQALRSVLCGEGYVSPARLGAHYVGASFRFDRSDTEPSAEENASNLELLTSLSPQLDSALRSGAALLPETLQGRAALRCTSPDYLPLIGPVVDAEQFRQDYAVLAKDASKQPCNAAPWHRGLYINAAHGSRGLISAPLSGELIGALLENEPLPLPSDLVRAVHPSRFLLRHLIRGA